MRNHIVAGLLVTTACATPSQHPTHEAEQGVTWNGIRTWFVSEPPPELPGELVTAAVWLAERTGVLVNLNDPDPDAQGDIHLPLIAADGKYTLDLLRRHDITANRAPKAEPNHFTVGEYAIDAPAGSAVVLAASTATETRGQLIAASLHGYQFHNLAFIPQWTRPLPVEGPLGARFARVPAAKVYRVRTTVVAAPRTRDESQPASQPDAALLALERTTNTDGVKLATGPLRAGTEFVSNSHPYAGRQRAADVRVLPSTPGWVLRRIETSIGSGGSGGPIVDRHKRELVGLQVAADDDLVFGLSNDKVARELRRLLAQMASKTQADWRDAIADFLRRHPRSAALVERTFQPGEGWGLMTPAAALRRLFETVPGITLY